MVIDIVIADSKLAKATRTEAAGRRRLGEQRFKLYKRRLKVLENAESLADVRNVGGFHALTADLAGSFAMDLDGPYRLVFRPDHDPVPTLDAGGVDLAAVQAVVIEGVVDYHG